MLENRGDPDLQWEDLGLGLLGPTWLGLTTLNFQALPDDGAYFQVRYSSIPSGETDRSFSSVSDRNRRTQIDELNSVRR